jgi:hypothetical protein
MNQNCNEEYLEFIRDLREDVWFADKLNDWFEEMDIPEEKYLKVLCLYLAAMIDSDAITFNQLERIPFIVTQIADQYKNLK